MDEFLRGKRLAIRFLTAKMYTAREIFDKLKRKGYSEEISERIISELMQESLLDDEKYAEYYILDSVNIGSKGMYRIRQELMRKGVARTIIDRAINEAEVDTTDVLREFVSQKLSVTEITTRKEFEKFRAMLARRGYSLGEIKDVLSEFEFDFSDDKDRY